MSAVCLKVKERCKYKVGKSKNLINVSEKRNYTTFQYKTKLRQLIEKACDSY